MKHLFFKKLAVGPYIIHKKAVSLVLNQHLTQREESGKKIYESGWCHICFANWLSATLASSLLKNAQEKWRIEQYPKLSLKLSKQEKHFVKCVSC